MQYDVIQYDVLQYDVIQYDVIQYDVIQYDVIQSTLSLHKFYLEVIFNLINTLRLFMNKHFQKLLLNKKSL